MDCIFCKIAKKEVEKEIIYENDSVIAFYDLHPMTPIHVLVIPKEHIESVNDLSSEKKMLAGELIVAAREIARKETFEDTDGERRTLADVGYKLLLRAGRYGQ